MENQVDEDGEYIYRRDEWYYGNIPNNCTREQLVHIMANALLKLQKDKLQCTGLYSTLTELNDILDGWFAHDSNTENKFDHIVPIEEFDDFVDDVTDAATIIKLAAN